MKINMYKTISLAFFTFLLEFSVYAAELSRLCLSVDVGSTKTSCLMFDLTKKEVISDTHKEIKSSTVLNTTNLTGKFEELAKPLSLDLFSMISIGLPCPVIEGVPASEGLKDLVQTLSTTDRECLLDNDAINWHKGAYAVLGIQRRIETSNKSLLIALGTATGLSYTSGNGNFEAIELCDCEGIDYSKLEQMLETVSPLGKWSQYTVLGKTFFRDSTFPISEECKIRFQSLAAAYLKAIINYLKQNYDFDTVIIGGGNASRYLDEDCLGMCVEDELEVIVLKGGGEIPLYAPLFPYQL